MHEASQFVGFVDGSLALRRHVVEVVGMDKRAREVGLDIVGVTALRERNVSCASDVEAKLFPPASAQVPGTTSA